MEGAVTGDSNKIDLSKASSQIFAKDAASSKVGWEKLIKQIISAMCSGVLRAGV
jgi:hypothetical protein